MIGDAGTSRKNGVVFNGAGTGNSSLSADDHVFADRVIMSYLNQVIDFSTRADHRRSERASIDASIGSYFDMMFDNQIADMGNFDMPLTLLLVAEPVRSKYGTGMNDDVIADLGVIVNDDVWI